MANVSYEVFLDEAFSPDEWVLVRSPHLQLISPFLFLHLSHRLQSVLELAASSASPDTFIQTVLTKLSLLSNDANASLDVAAHTLQVPAIQLPPTTRFATPFSSQLRTHFVQL
jgi:hypothetical protein